MLNSNPIYPLSPVAPPTLMELNDSTVSSQRGLFLINLTEAVGRRDTAPYRDEWNGFLFKVVDLNTSNITYIWEVKLPNINLKLLTFLASIVLL